MLKTITITECNRRRNTRSGNPVFLITDGDGNTYRTEPDSGSAYTIVDGRTGWADVHINDQGRITQVQYL